MSHVSTQSPQTRNVVSRGRFFFAGLSFLALRLSFVSTVALGLWMFFQQGTVPAAEVIALISLVSVLLLSGINVLANARKVTCPLCRASLFMSSRSLVKPGVPKILGCAKTPLAFSLLTVPEVMSCPCCAEKVRLTRSA